MVSPEELTRKIAIHCSRRRRNLSRISASRPIALDGSANFARGTGSEIPSRSRWSTFRSQQIEHTNISQVLLAVDDLYNQEGDPRVRALPEKQGSTACSQNCTDVESRSTMDDNGTRFLWSTSQDSSWERIRVGSYRPLQQMARSCSDASRHCCCHRALLAPPCLPTAWLSKRNSNRPRKPFCVSSDRYPVPAI